jgi:serine-type D-Ala-D-Ala carboxypeptidase
LSQDITRFLRHRILDTGHVDFPGLKLCVHYQGRPLVQLSYGQVYPYYDMASLTKVIFTTTYFIHAISQKKLKLQDAVGSYLPWYPHLKTTIGNLLNHSAGNQWWQPLYKSIPLQLDNNQRYQVLERLCRSLPISKSKKAVYSDIDFFLLGSVMQVIENKPLSLIWQDIFGQFFSDTNLHFNSNNQPTHALTQYAPTEKCSWRKKILRGQVHDENAWALGGVAPHAGLFGGIEDLSYYGLWLRQQYSGEGKDMDPKVVSKFCGRSLPQSRGDWGYGFMLPSSPKSSAGQRMSMRSFGHTGFTGTSLWYDPQRDLLVCLLSNRVHPSRKQQGFVHLRPLLHDWIIEYIEGDYD